MQKAFAAVFAVDASQYERRKVAPDCTQKGSTGSINCVAGHGFMDLISTDVAIIGAGGTGLRAAIAVAEADPSLSLCLLSKVYPMRSHTVAAEGGAAAVIKDDDNLDYHFHDTVAGGDWLCDQDAVELFVK